MTKNPKEEMPTFQVVFVYEAPGVSRGTSEKTLSLPEIQKTLGRLQLKYGVPLELTDGRVSGVTILEYDTKATVKSGTLLVRYWRVLGEGRSYSPTQTKTLVSTYNHPPRHYKEPEKEIEHPKAIKELLALGSIIGKNKNGYY